jgi:gamma-glutamyltranspeptidase / glutathione hydrolase
LAVVSSAIEILEEIMDGKRPTVASLHGVVTAAHPLAAQAGARLLMADGNAFDAAAATAAALNVVEPYMSGLAGEGVATCYVAAEKRVRALDFVTRIPLKFPAGHFTDREQIHRSPLSIGTPGSLAGWCELVRAYGRKSLMEVLAPAIALARDGFPLIEFNTAHINSSSQDLKDLPFYGEWKRNYTADKGRVRQGEVLRQRELARSLEEIAADGPGAVYGGRVGRAIVAHVVAVGGCLTLDDLEGVSPEWQEPTAAAYRDLLVHVPPPPCEAFQFLQTLRILDGFDLSTLEPNAVEHLDIVYRAIRLAAGERIAHNKPDMASLCHLLSDSNIDKLRTGVKNGKPLDGPTEQWLTPQPVNLNKEHTTSMSIADREGNVVCITQSLGGAFGCGVVVPGTGICLNNFLYWGEVDVRGKNPLKPGQSLALPIAPSISTKDGKPVLSLGTPGSYGICQTQPQAVVQYKDFGLGLQDAIEAPRARLWDGQKVQAENRLAATTVEALRARGHDIEMVEPFTMIVGGMQAVAIDPQTGAMTGAADPRRDSYAATA